jgi:hypothetical protein
MIPKKLAPRLVSGVCRSFPKRSCANTRRLEIDPAVGHISPMTETSKSISPLAEWVGGLDSLRGLTARFHEKVPSDPLAPVFARTGGIALAGWVYKEIR